MMRVRMDVDKAGHDHQPGAVDDAVRGAGEMLAEKDDTVVGKGEIDTAAVGVPACGLVPGNHPVSVLDQRRRPLLVLPSRLPCYSEAMATSGPRNLITDVPGILVGQAEDRAAITGTTVVLAEAPAVAAVDVRGGAPGSRETELLGPATLVERVDAIVLSGGSAFGLDAASGVDGLACRTRSRFWRSAQRACRSCRRRSCSTSTFPGRGALDRRAAASPARLRGNRGAGKDFALGNHGAGLGAKAGVLKGGTRQRLVAPRRRHDGRARSSRSIAAAP
jgi:hypothetical protein